MDAPLVLTTRLNPTEVDKEALNVDSVGIMSVISMKPSRLPASKVNC